MTSPPVRFGAACFIVLAALAPSMASTAQEHAAALEVAAKDAEVGGRIKDAFDLYVRAVQALPDPPPLDVDVRLRRRAITLALRLQPKPVPPPDAERFTVRGQFVLKEASNETAFEEAANELRQAVRAAPWVPEFAFNLALVQEKLAFYKSAATNLELYALANPPDVVAVRAKVYELEIRREKSPPITVRKEDCSFGDFNACGMLAKQYLADNEKQRAYPLLVRGCNAGHVKSCGDLVYNSGALRPTWDVPAPAAAVVKKACTETADRESCYVIGWAYTYGRGVSQNFGEAARSFQLACDAGHDYGCLNLGHQYLIGKGVPQDTGRAAVLFDRTCTLDASTCWWIGSLFERGPEDYPKDRKRAALYFARACSLGYRSACDDAKRVK